MKKAFIPYDYSELSRNTADYACNFAKEYGLSLIFFHGFNLPAISTESAFINYPIEEIFNENKKSLEHEADAVLKNNNTEFLQKKIIVKAGFSVDALIQNADEESADIIIMHVTKRGRLGQILLGSNGVFTSRKSLIPVLLIPENYRFKKIEKIVFAADTEKKISKGLIDYIIFWKSFFHAELEIINFYEEKKQQQLLHTIGELNLENETSHVPHKTFYLAEDVKNGLEKHISKSKPDLLILLPGKHSLIGDVLQKSLTNYFANTTDMPIFCIKREE